MSYRKASKRAVHDEAGPYTTAAFVLNCFGIRYVIWGHFALLLAFRCPAMYDADLESVDYVIADNDVLRAVKTLERFSYKQETDAKFVLSGCSYDVGQYPFPEVRTLSYCGPDEDPVYPGLPRPLPINLIPASLVKFEFRLRHTKTFNIHLYEDSEWDWPVCHATLPAMLDSTLSLCRTYARQEEDLDSHRIFTEKYYVFEEDYMGLSDEEIRRALLWQHAVRSLTALMFYTFSRHETGLYASYAELPRRKKDVAGNLSGENRELYLQLCIHPDVEEERKAVICRYREDPGVTDEEDAYGDETWEEVFGVIPAVSGYRVQ
ncbi:hypothetical protein BJ508DRAFT_323553 [Ascobolus immersus RN42]|uniref:Uncharacterized protein n=1 Tax=Ascobolus immersus RN42 TaxID=1160509 RepID=A0A3N4IGB1_ASCIM|nr:hypothetical protein BJ508DRAFT_323553 [Ascobolus immersus RN42]